MDKTDRNGFSERLNRLNVDTDNAENVEKEEVDDESVPQRGEEQVSNIFLGSNGDNATPEEVAASVVEELAESRLEGTDDWST